MTRLVEATVNAALNAVSSAEKHDREMKAALAL